MNPPLITVAICSYNGERYLERTLNSVLAQDYPNYEIVIVDDGSTDGTVSIIERFAGLNKSIRPFFRRNHGLPVSRSFSFAQAKGEWIAIIDQDDLCYPTRLSRQFRIAQRYPTAGFVFCNVHHINEADEVIGDHMSRFALPESFIRKGEMGNLLLKLNCFAASASCFIKRETVQVVGAYDESRWLTSAIMITLSAPVSRSISRIPGIFWEPGGVTPNRPRTPTERRATRLALFIGGTAGVGMHRSGPKWSCCETYSSHSPEISCAD